MPLPAPEYTSSIEENPWIKEFAQKWVASKDDRSLDDDAVVDLEMRIKMHCDADTKLIVILAIAAHMEDGRHDNLLAAGMLEDFLGDHGEEYIDIIKELARIVPRFRRILAGVWQGRMKKGVWHIVQAEADYPTRYGKN